MLNAGCSLFPFEQAKVRLKAMFANAEIEFRVEEENLLFIIINCDDVLGTQWKIQTSFFADSVDHIIDWIEERREQFSRLRENVQNRYPGSELWYDVDLDFDYSFHGNPRAMEVKVRRFAFCVYFSNDGSVESYWSPYYGDPFNERLWEHIERKWQENKNR